MNIADQIQATTKAVVVAVAMWRRGDVAAAAMWRWLRSTPAKAAPVALVEAATVLLVSAVAVFVEVAVAVALPVASVVVVAAAVS